MDYSPTYREFPPPRGLEGEVACFWVLRAPPDVAGRPQLVVPNGSAELVCEPGRGESRLVGALTGPRRATPVPGRTLVGARFRPGAAAAVLGAQPRELRDVDVPLECCWGQEGARLAERSAEATSTTAVLAVLARVLRARVDPRVEPRFAAEARERLQPWRVRTTAAVGREMFLSERQLRRRFLTVFGFAPKELQRILRFQVFLALVQGPRRDQVRFAHLAAQLGYADQSHLSRECLRLAGLAPGRLVRELAESCGPDHDHTVSFAPLRVRFLQDAVA